MVSTYVISSTASTISVRRASPWSSRISVSSATMMASMRAGWARMSLQVRDQDADLLQLVDDLLALQAGEALQLQVEDGLGLDLGEAEARHQAGARVVRGAGGADQGDHLVQVVEGDGEALEDVGPGLRLAQLEGGAPAHHLAAEVEEELADLEQVQHPRPLLDDGQHDDPEGVLELGVLVEVVQHHLGRLALLDVDHDAHAVAVALVPDVGDAVDALLVVQLGDLLDEARLVDLVGDLGDDDRLLVALADLDLRPGPHHDRAAAGPVGLADAGAAADEARGREVGAGDALHHALQPLLRGEVLALEHEVQRVHHLAQVVGRDVGGHADGDAGGAVHEQVGEDGGQDGGLGRAVVVGRLVVDGVLVDVRHHGRPEAGEARLGVPHGRGRIAVDGAEVALAVDQGRAQVEVLRHAHEGVVDGLVAVGVVVAHHLADDLGRLLVGPARLQAHLLHAVEHAPVGGLQAVADVGQGAADDDGHGVGHVRLLHLVGEVGGDAVPLGRVGCLAIRCRGCGRSGRSPR